MQTLLRVFLRELMFSVSLKVDGPQARYCALIPNSTANQCTTKNGEVD